MRRWIVRALAALALATTAEADFAGTITYTYDALGRLTSASYGDGTIVCYYYDSVGNRTQYKVGTTVC